MYETLRHRNTTIVSRPVFYFKVHALFFFEGGVKDISYETSRRCLGDIILKALTVMSSYFGIRVSSCSTTGVPCRILSHDFPYAIGNNWDLYRPAPCGTWVAANAIPRRPWDSLSRTLGALCLGDVYFDILDTICNSAKGVLSISSSAWFLKYYREQPYQLKFYCFDIS